MYHCVEVACQFSSEDPRVICNHILEVHKMCYGFCLEEECKGKVFSNPRGHWDDHHAGDKICDFCNEVISNHMALRKHFKAIHPLELGIVHAQQRPPSTHQDLQITLKTVLSAPPMKFLQLSDNFGVFYDMVNNRPVIGAEVLYPDILANSLKIDRPPGFKFNLDLPTNQVTPATINYLGLHCGHIIPAANWSSSDKDYLATFNNANITPMFAGLNMGVWQNIESQGRKLGASSLSTIAITLMHYESVQATKSIGNHQLHIPSSFTKIYYADKGNDTWLAQPFHVKNEDQQRNGTKTIWKFRKNFEEIPPIPGVTIKQFPYTWKQKANIYSCTSQDCHAAFYTYAQLKSHREGHLADNRCLRCKRTFDTLDLLTEHRPFCQLRCQFCEKVFTKNSHLVRHESMHTGNNPFRCEEPNCSRTFPTAERLRAHVDRFHREWQFKCTICDKAAPDQSGLNKHMRTHNKVKRYKCSLCEYVCDVPKDMRRHQGNRHAGEGTLIEMDEWKEMDKQRKEALREAEAHKISNRRARSPHNPE